MNKLEKEIVELTEDLIRFKTVKGNKEEFEQAFDYIKDYFADTDLLVQEFENEGYTTLVVSTDEDPEIMLHGHIDVVGADDRLFEPEQRDGRLYGRGSSDMKSGVACLMKLMRDDVSKEDSVGLMIVSDEEIGGFKGAKYVLDEEIFRPSFAISAEPNNTENYMEVIVEQKGVVRLVLNAEGKNAHGSRPWHGVNAAEKLWQNYSQFKRNFTGSEENWSTTVNLGSFHSGDTFNVVPDNAEAKLDIRFTHDYGPEAIEQDLEKMDIDYEILSVDPMLKTDPENSYVQELLAASETVLESRLEAGKKEPASDVRHFSGIGIPGVVFGPEGYNVHQDDECLEISGLKDYYRVMAEFLTRLS